MAITRVQGAENNTGFGASITATLGATVTSGDALCVMVITNVAGVPTLSDNGSGGSATYTRVTTSAAQGGYTAYTFYALNVTNGLKTVTATPSSSGQIYLIVDEFSGIATSAALDGTGNINNQATAPNTSNGVTSGSITTATSGDLIWSACFASAGVSMTQGTGYTAGTNLGGFTFLGSEYKIQSASGAVAATFTVGTNNTPTMTGVFALKAAGAGPIAYTLAGAEGAFVISGQAATTAAARKMAGVEGAFTISGQTAGMLRGIKMGNSEGSFTISGQSSTELRGIKMGGAEGAFTISGQSGVLGHGINMAAVEGSFAISGEPAKFPVALSMNGLEGTFTINGLGASLVYTPSGGGPTPVHSNPFLATPGATTTLP